MTAFGTREGKDLKNPSPRGPQRRFVGRGGISIAHLKRLALLGCFFGCSWTSIFTSSLEGNAVFGLSSFFGWDVSGIKKGRVSFSAAVVFSGMILLFALVAI